MSQSRKIFVALLVTVCLSWTATAGERSGRDEVVKVFPPGVPVVAAARGTVELPLRIEIAAGFHINAKKPTLNYLIPTKLKWTSKDFRLLDMEYPPAERYAFSFAPGKSLKVYQGTVSIRSRFRVPGRTPPGKVTLHGVLRYQACDDNACYPPKKVAVEAPVYVVKSRKP